MPRPDRQTLAATILRLEESGPAARALKLRTPGRQQPARANSARGAAQPEPEAVPAAGTVLLQSELQRPGTAQQLHHGSAVPGDLETVTPVLGHLNSVYGYRDHPINGV
ncbi:MAG: hypothetical protein V8S34_04750 [Lawsonibacter sp.]